MCSGESAAPVRAVFEPSDLLRQDERARSVRELAFSVLQRLVSENDASAAIRCHILTKKQTRPFFSSIHATSDNCQKNKVPGQGFPILIDGTRTSQHKSDCLLWMSVSLQLLHYISTVRLLPRMSHLRDAGMVSGVIPCLPVPFFDWFSELTIPLFRHIFLHPCPPILQAHPG